MFFVHDEIRIDGEPPVCKRVLWVAPDRSRIALLTVTDPESWPELIGFVEAELMVTSGAWSVVAGEAPSPKPDALLLPSARRRRDQNWDVIRTMVTQHVPAVFDKMPRSALVTAAMKAHGKSRNTVKALLLLYFRGGMTKAALLPDWEKCGAPGVARPVEEGAPKRGRPVEAGPPGVNVDAEMRRLFGLAISMSYARERKHSLRSAYMLCMRAFFMTEVADEKGRPKHETLPAYAASGLPRFEQFEYWAGRDNDMVALAQRRMTPRVYEQKNKALLGTSTAEATGPCSRFQIDATILDVHLRSRRLPGQLIGRPTLYVVIDVFSRMIVGVYIGLESPSWLAAMMALANCVADKVEFCRSFGVEILPDEWPTRHVPGILEGDRGEIESAKIDSALAMFNIRVENAAAYRGDWKGVVESRFRTLPAVFKPYVPGYIEAGFKQRGERDYRADAVLDIDDLTRIVIDLVLYFNNDHELKGYPRHPGLTRDGVPSVPLDMWNWGIANLSGAPRAPRPDTFRFALMPCAEATVWPEGLVFEGRFYVCDRAVEERWFTKARTKRFKVPISYDKRFTDAIYVHDPQSECGFQVARLTDRSQNRVGISGWEAAGMDAADRLLSANRRDAQIAARADAEADIERTVEAAVERTGAATAISVASQTLGIQAARAVERASDRRVEARAFLPAPAALVEQPPVLMTRPPPQPEHGQPSLRDRKRALEKQDD